MKGSSVTVDTLLDRKGRQVYSITPDASVYSAIEQMSKHSVGALVVIQFGRLAGIISERDYTRKVILEGRSSKDTAVEEIMSPGVVTICASATVVDGLRLMTAQRVRHLPVVASDGIVVGVLSIGDLVKQVIAEQETTIDQLQSYIAGAYPY